MGNVRRRLDRLERGGGVDEDQEEATRREALARVTDEDLKLVWGYLERTEGEDGEPTEEEWAAILRYEELREEVEKEARGPRPVPLRERRARPG